MIDDDGNFKSGWDAAAKTAAAIFAWGVVGAAILYLLALIITNFG